VSCSNRVDNNMAPVLRKPSSFSVFRRLFMSLPSLIDIRDIVRPGQSCLPIPLGDHTEFADPKFPLRECLLMVQVYLAPDGVRAPSL
jgi:hypothetical protein